MIQLLLAVPFLVEPILYPSTLSGRVGMVGGQPRMEVSGGWNVALTGDLARDMQGFNGALMTVRGEAHAEGFEVRALAPGRVSGLFTGIVSVSCDGGSCSPRLRLGDRSLKVGGKLDPKLFAALDGALVTVRGAESPAGIEADSGFILVRGNLQALAYPGSSTSEPHTGNQILYWGERSIVVDSGADTGIHGQNVWVGGRLEASADGRPSFKAVFVSLPIAGPPLGGFAPAPRSGVGQER